MGFAPTAPDHRGPERRESGRESEVRTPRAEGRPEAQGPVGETSGDLSGSSIGTTTKVSLRICRRIFGSSNRWALGPVRWTFGSVKSSALGSRVRSSDRTDCVVFGPHKLTTSVDSFRSEPGPRPGTERTRVPRGLRLRSRLPRGLLASGLLSDSNLPGDLDRPDFGLSAVDPSGGLIFEPRLFFKHDSYLFVPPFGHVVSIHEFDRPG